MIRGLVGSLAGRDDVGGEDIEAAYDTGPLVRSNFVVTLDGAVELGGVSGSLGGPADLEMFATLRALADVVVVAAGTARSEDYGPAWLAPDRRDRRQRRGQVSLPTVAVVTRSADLEPAARLFAERRSGQPSPPRPIILTCGAAPAAQRASLEAVADVVICGDERVELWDALDALRRAGLPRVLCEGGPQLFAGLIAADLLDEVCLTHAPVLAGPGRVPLTGGTRSDASADEPGFPARFRLADLLEGDGLLLARYLNDRGAAPAADGGGGARRDD